MNRVDPLDPGERFRLLVDSVRDYAIFMLDQDGRVATWNAGAQRLKGYRADEIIGQHFSIFYTEGDKTAEKPKRELEIAIETGRYEEEGWRVRRDGTLFWANVVISSVRSESGELIGFAKVTRDLTERRAHEQRLQTMVNELTRSNRELDEYAAFVSHDLQEPLRKMAGFAELLAHDYGDKLEEDARGHIRAIVDAAGRMRILITDVLDYSRIGRAEPSMRETSLDDAAAGALRALSAAIEEAGARVDVAPLPRVRGNPRRLAELFEKLLSNAVKFRDPARPLLVRISARHEGGERVISVSDNGIGFDMRHAERILRPFQRLHPKEMYPGSGVGLAAAKKIIELHKGRLWAESEPGRGATFSFALPEEQ